LRTRSEIPPDTEPEAPLSLQESEIRYRELFNHMRSGVVVFRPQGDGDDFIVIDFNQAAERIEGIRKEEVIGRRVAEIFPAVKEFGLFNVFRRVWRTGAAEHHPISFYRDERISGWRENDVYRLPSGEIVAVYNDVTLHKEAEENLQIYKQIVSVAQELMAFLDAGLVFRAANQAFLKAHDQGPEDVIGRNIAEVYGPALYERKLRSRLEQALAGEQVRFETWLDFAATGRRYMDVAYYPFREKSGAIGGIVISARDITSRKQAEEDLRQAQKMEALGTLAGGIAHDFNNILHAMLGYTELAINELPEDCRAHRHLQEVVKAGRRAADLVNQILTFSRQTEQERRPMLMQPVIKEALKLLRSSLPTTIEIRAQIDPDCCPVLADLTQIHQVVMNLCTNSYHAMRDTGGLLEVKLEEVDVDAEIAAAHADLTAGRYARLTVRDTGHGIDKAIMSRIFDPYFTTKKPSEGTGLGLATVHGIVKSHDGAITVQSTPGQGATFEIYIPVLKQQIASQAAAKHEGKFARLTTGRVLVVDDEEPIVRLEQKLLEKIGCQVTALTSSTEALALFEADPGRFDAVITDQTMPHLTGLELATRVLAIRPDMPVTLITGYSDLVDAERAKKAGVREFLLKPIAKGELERTISRLLASK